MASQSSSSSPTVMRVGTTARPASRRRSSACSHFSASQATPIAALELATSPSGAVQHRELMQKEAEQIAQSQPEHVALQVQQWMNE